VSGSRKYVIRFKGLKTGKHSFAFNVDRTFFEQFENNDIIEAACHIDVDMTKQERMFELLIHITGTVDVHCDRCLGLFQLPRDILETIVVKISNTEVTKSDDIIIVSDEEHELDISQILYEFILLSLPYQCIHPVDKEGKSTCDPEMIRQLNIHSGGKEKRESDPRWDQLKGLIITKK
jgi:uncharacterized protein